MAYSHNDIMADVALMMKSHSEAYVVVVDEGKNGPIATVYKGFLKASGTPGVAFGPLTDPIAVGELTMMLTSPVRHRSAKMKMGDPNV